MNKKTKILQTSLLAVSLAAFGATSACNRNGNTANSSQSQQIGQNSNALTKLSAEEVQMLFKTLPPQSQQMLAAQPEQIKNFLDDLKTLLAVAAEARRQPWANEPDVKQQLDFLTSSVVAGEFERSKNAGAAQPPQMFGDVKPEEIENFYKDQSNEAKFNSFMDSMKKRMAASGGGKTEFSEPEMKQLRENWAKLALTEQKAREAGFDKRRETELQIAIQQSRYLAQEYARRSEDKLAPTEAEVAEHIRQHPELDPAKKRQQAEQVLQRAKAGEDFAKLADEFSEDPGNADPETGDKKGGLYEGIKKGEFVPQFEAAAMKLEKGGVSDLVETQYGFHIIKLENKKGDTYSVRHILFGTTAPNAGNSYAQPMNLQENAREDLKSQKRDKWLEEVAARNPVSVPRPEEIKLEPPPVAEMPAKPFGEQAAPEKK